MKAKTYAKFSLLLLFFFLFVAYAAGQSARGKGRVSGVVVDEKGDPVISAKVTIEFLGADTAKLETTSKKRGWSFLGLGTGKWKVTATADGYIPFATEIYVQQLAKNPKVTLTLAKIQSADLPIIEDELTFEILDKGNQLYSEKKYDEALLAFQEFLEKNPKAYQVRLNISDCYREMGEYKKAIEEYNIVLGKTSKDEHKGKEITARALAGIGDCYLKMQDFESAQNYFKQSIETYPDNEVIAYNVGEIYFSNQKLDEAIQYFGMASQIKSDWSDPYYKLGLVYLNKSDFDKAKENFEKFLTLEPDTERSANVRNILDQLKK
ncbi:MAG: tetratricopeptide repeat protein [Candidatus Aminicenantaceae bacterium]